LEFFHDDELEAKSYDSALMKRILGYLRNHKALVAVSVALLVVESLFQLAPPYLVKIAIDRYIAPGSAARDRRPLRRALKIVGLFFGLLFAAFAASYVQIYVMAYVGQRVMYEMRMQIFRHLQRKEVAYFDKNPSAVDDAADERRRGVERDVHLGAVAIFLDAFTLLGIMVVLCLSQPAARAGELRRTSPPLRRGDGFSRQGARELSEREKNHRGRERLPPGEHHRDERRPGVRARKDQFDRFTRHNRLFSTPTSSPSSPTPGSTRPSKS